MTGTENETGSAPYSPGRAPSCTCGEFDCETCVENAAEARLLRYEQALRRIASEDYRGNRPPSSVIAQEALDA